MEKIKIIETGFYNRLDNRVKLMHEGDIVTFIDHAPKNMYICETEDAVRIEVEIENSKEI